MNLNTDFIKTISEDKIKNCLNDIVIENDTEKRKELIIKLYTLDLIHTAHEGTFNKSIVVFVVFIFQTYDKREPTNEEYIEFFVNNMESTLYKFQNATEYKSVLTKTTLRKLLFELYFEESIKGRMLLLSKYLSNPKKKTIKPKKTTKQEYINILKSNGYYSVDKYDNLNKAPRDILKRYCHLWVF